MATTIRSACPVCGDVDLPVDAVVLIRNETRIEYHYTCPKCGDRVKKRADKKIVALLISAGVEFMPEFTPYPEKKPAKLGAPITYDDLIDFHFSKELAEL